MKRGASRMWLTLEKPAQPLVFKGVYSFPDFRPTGRALREHSRASRPVWFSALSRMNDLPGMISGARHRDGLGRDEEPAQPRTRLFTHRSGRQATVRAELAGKTSPDVPGGGLHRTLPIPRGSPYRTGRVRGFRRGGGWPGGGTGSAGFSGSRGGAGRLGRAFSRATMSCSFALA